MTKQNEFAFSELINTDNGFMLIRYDTLKDYEQKISMIETDQYAGLNKRFLEAVRKETISGEERHAPMTAQQPPPAQAPQQPPPEKPRPQQQPITAQQPPLPPTPQQPQGQPQSDESIKTLASQYNTPEAYLEAIDFRISEKDTKHKVAYFRTEKSGNVSTAYLNVFKTDDGFWGMTKWMIREKKKVDYHYSWGYPYTEIVGVVDAIDAQGKMYGN